MSADSQPPGAAVPSGSDASIPNAAPTNVRWLIFALACGTSWFMYLHRYTWNIVGPELKKQYGWSDTEMQFAYSLFNWTYGFCQIPSGTLCDFVGPHLFLGIIITVWSLIIPLYGIRMGLPAIGGLRLMFGFAQAGGYPILAKVTQAWFPFSYRTQVQAWVATFFGRSGGAMSSILMSTVLIGALHLSWQMSLVVLGAAGALFGLLFLILFRNSPDSDPRVNAAERAHIREGHVGPVSSERRIMPWGEAIKNRSMACFVVQQMFVAGADTIFASLMGAYFYSRGLDIKSVGWIISLPLWGGAVGGILGGMLNDALLRNQRQRLLLVGGIAGMVLAACTRSIYLVMGSAAGSSGIGAPSAGTPAGSTLEPFLQGVLSVGGFTLAGGVGGVLAICLLLPAAGSRRWGRSSIGFGGNLLASILILVTIRQESILATGIALFTVKYFADMSQPTQWGACTDIGGRFSATVFGIINTAGNIGGIVFPPIFGFILGLSTTETLVNGVKSSVTDYAPMFYLISGMYVVGAICWMMIDCTRTVDRGQHEPAVAGPPAR